MSLRKKIKKDKYLSKMIAEKILPKMHLKSCSFEKRNYVKNQNKKKMKMKKTGQKHFLTWNYESLFTGRNC